jgi:hypothetical protein
MATEYVVYSQRLTNPMSCTFGKYFSDFISRTHTQLLYYEASPKGNLGRNISRTVTRRVEARA